MAPEAHSFIFSQFSLEYADLLYSSDLWLTTQLVQHKPLS
jgi:hypothetical protein